MKPTTAAGAGGLCVAADARPTTVKPFDPDEILNLTTYLTVVDKDRNMVSLTSSLLSGFGSGLVVERRGFFMNDRMRYYYLDPKRRELAAAGQARAADHQSGDGAQGRQAVDGVRHARAPTRSRRRSCSSSSTSPSSG